MTDRPAGSGAWLGSWAARLGRLQRAIRKRIVPLGAVVDRVPTQGRILELGCGEGLVLERLAPRAEGLVGVDLDERKLLAARGLLKEVPGLDLVTLDAFDYLGGCADGAFRAVILADTLSSFSREGQERLLREAFRVVEPGGTLILKVIDAGARFKAAFSRLLSSLVYRVLRMSYSEGQRFLYLSSEDLRRILESLGADVTVDPVHRRLLHPVPHVVILGRKPLERAP